jgi:GNAT superfamily N-acetyltransferase
MNVFLIQMEEDYDIINATEKDRDSIAEFLRQNFYNHEPLNQSIGANPDRPINAIFSLQFLSEGKSVLAVSRNGRRILGVCINTEQKPTAKEDTEFTLLDPAYITIADFFRKVESSVDIWKVSGADRIMRINIVAVHAAARGRGIGRVLMEATRSQARRAGYSILYILCSSHYSARIARDMGMQSLYSLPYTEYRDKNGRIVFTPPLPHTEVTIFVQKLCSETQ